MDIDGWRAKIDVIDEVLVELLNRRAECALEIGEIKKAKGIGVYAPDRERWVLSEVRSLNRGPLSDEAMMRLFERIIDESRRLEREASEEALGSPT
jgi:chorismate mutase